MRIILFLLVHFQLWEPFDAKDISDFSEGKEKTIAGKKGIFYEYNSWT